MDFKETQAIYLQIVDLVCDHIVTGKWKAQERIPSVRELGVQLEVNPNTVMRAYDYLQAREIICNKRGVGFFVTEGASKQITESRRRVCRDGTARYLPANEFIGYSDRIGRGRV